MASARFSCASAAMELMVMRLCSMARAGCWMKRSSRRIVSSVASAWTGLSLTSRSTTFSMTSMNGRRMTTLTKRKSVLTKAMETLDIVMLMKSKCTKALTR